MTTGTDVGVIRCEGSGKGAYSPKRGEDGGTCSVCGEPVRLVGLIAILHDRAKLGSEL